MTAQEISDLLTSNIGKAVRVTPVGGEPELLLVLSVDKEGFTYQLLASGQDQSVKHWWPTDEVTEIEGPLEPPQSPEFGKGP